MRVPPNDRGDTDGRDEAHLKRLAHLRVLETVSDDGNRTLVLSGELDLASSWLVDLPLLKISADGTRSFTLDLSGVTFIDSTALGVLIEARTKLANRRGFLLASPGLETKRALEVSGLDRHFVVHDTVDAALSASLQ